MQESEWQDFWEWLTSKVIIRKDSKYIDWDYDDGDNCAGLNIQFYLAGYLKDKLKEWGSRQYVKYEKYKYIRSDHHVILVPVICGFNRYKNLIYVKTNKKEHQYELIGEEINA